MKRPGIFSQMAVACGLGLLVLLLEGILAAFFSVDSAFRGLLVLAQMGYLACLLRAARPGLGGLTLGLLNISLAGLLLLLPADLGTLLLLWGLILSCNRIILFRPSPVSAGLDLAVSLAGIFFFGYLQAHSNGLALAFWGYFLVQAATGVIPLSFSVTSRESSTSDPFADSSRQARQALEQILKSSSAALRK